MRIEKDFEDFLGLLNKNKVKYCIVGAYAVALHVRPRYTKDIDILVDVSKRNAGRIKKSIDKFGMKSLNLTEKDFLKKGNIIQLGYEPVRVDIVTDIKGCSFDKVWQNKRVARYGKENVYFIGLNELIKNKKSTGRKQDIVDLDILLKKRKNWK